MFFLPFYVFLGVFFALKRDFFPAHTSPSLSSGNCLIYFYIEANTRRSLDAGTMLLIINICKCCVSNQANMSHFHPPGVVGRGSEGRYFNYFI